jgi:LysM repeat protein
VTLPAVLPSYPLDPGYPVVDPAYPVDPGYGYDDGYGQAVCAYTVAPGDTLSWIAKSMGVSQYDLIAANGIVNPDFVYVGQVLHNPSCGAGGYGLGAAPAEPYADAYAVASYSGAVTDYPLAAAAPVGEMGAGEMGAEFYASGASYDDAGYGGDMYADYPAGDYAASGYADTGYADTGYGDVEMPAAVRPGDSYTVQVGDNLSQIAASYGVSVDEMLAVNGIQNPNIIYVGQQLVIP